MDAKKEDIVRFTATFISSFGVGVVVGATGKIIKTVLPSQLKIPYMIGEFAISCYIGNKVGDYMGDYAVHVTNELEDAFETLSQKREALA